MDLFYSILSLVVAGSVLLMAPAVCRRIPRECARRDAIAIAWGVVFGLLGLAAAWTAGHLAFAFWPLLPIGAVGLWQECQPDDVVTGEKQAKQDHADA